MSLISNFHVDGNGLDLFTMQSARYELAHQSEEMERDRKELERLKESVGLKDIQNREQAAKIKTLEFQL